MVAYDRQTVNSPNPIARFSHRRRAAKSVALAEKYLPSRGIIADFGAGTGLFLSALGDRRKDAALYAIEPYMPPSADPRIRYLSDLKMAAESFDVITAFETCEHLTSDELNSLIADCKVMLQSKGKLIISVPIMIGMALPLKDISRSLLFKRPLEYSFPELVGGVFGSDVARPVDPRPTHKGFDFRALRSRLTKDFLIDTEFYSPLPLPWWANSQVFFVCSKRSGGHSG